MCCLFTWLPAGMWLDTQVEVLCPPSGTLKGDVWHIRLDFFQMSHNDIHTCHKMTFLFFPCMHSMCFSLLGSLQRLCEWNLSSILPLHHVWVGASVRPPLTLTLTLNLMGARTNGQFVGQMGGWTKGPKPGCQSVLSYLWTRPITTFFVHQ